MLLPLLAMLAGAALAQQVTTPSTSFFPFEGIADPSKQCLDIFCYAPIQWSDSKSEVCRYRKERNCRPKSEEVCINVPVTSCELVGYTECTTNDNPQALRDDKVVGEFFNEQTCETNPIDITELKKKQHCVNQTMTKCEKMWIKEAPYWKDVNCQQLTWEKCTMEEHPIVVEIDYCNCTQTEIWYNKFKEEPATVNCTSTTCVPKAVPVCKTTQERRCTTVTWEECEVTCDNECSEQHFKEPSQEQDHRRWCSHVEILLPPGVSPVPPKPRNPKSFPGPGLPTMPLLNLK